MKILRMMVAALVIFLSGAYSVQAQQTKKEKEQTKQAELKKMVDTKRFTFTAQTAIPMGGGSINLTSEYDLEFNGDTIVAYLPYFGRAYVAPINPTEGGIKFTSTKFDYKPQAKKNGSYEIVIKPTDAKDVRMMVLSLTTSGYGSLSVSSQNKQPISFYGRIDENKKKKD